MNKLVILLILMATALIPASGCATAPQTTEPTAVSSSPAVTETTAATIPNAGGGGPALTLVPSDPKEAFRDAILNADLIVSGYITDKKYEIVTVAPKPAGDNTTGTLAGASTNATPGRIVYTIFTLTVEKVIKGNPAVKQVLIRAEGGIIEGVIAQLASGHYFSISDHVLLGLHLESDGVGLQNPVAAHGSGAISTLCRQG